MAACKNCAKFLQTFYANAKILLKICAATNCAEYVHKFSNRAGYQCLPAFSLHLASAPPSPLSLIIVYFLHALRVSIFKNTFSLRAYKNNLTLCFHAGKITCFSLFNRLENARRAH